MCGESRLSQGLDDGLARRVSHRLVILGCVCDWTDEDVRALMGGVCDTPIIPHRLGMGPVDRTRQCNCAGGVRVLLQGKGKRTANKWIRWSVKFSVNFDAFALVIPSPGPTTLGPRRDVLFVGVLVIYNGVSCERASATGGSRALTLAIAFSSSGQHAGVPPAA
uniref:Uncharacterized protein n=1 Tax=Ananas comosus var. bracteatus TaxID=296719 RepID=A0A6V7NXK2_ANACO|nr:unnamed protein product [Ananas comosus var. bracteatus]